MMSRLYRCAHATTVTRNWKKKKKKKKKRACSRRRRRRRREGWWRAPLPVDVHELLTAGLAA